MLFLAGRGPSDNGKGSRGYDARVVQDVFEKEAGRAAELLVLERAILESKVRTLALPSAPCLEGRTQPSRC